MNSIRRTLLLALLGAICLTMAIAGWATFRAARHEADALFDYHLRQIALSVRDQTFLGSAEFLANDEKLDYVIRVWDFAGLTLYSSKPHEALPEITQLGYSGAETKEGEWRIFATQYHGMTIAVAQPMRVRNQLAIDAAWSTLRPFLIGLPILGALIWGLVGFGLRPLARLADLVKKRTPDSLSPLPENGLPEELRPLVTSLNDLLARLQAAFVAQRDFVADAAHELRTPLAALQLQAQLVERAVDDAARQAALDDLKQGLVRAGHTVHQLLTLARQEPGAISTALVPVTLATLARESVIDFSRLAEAKGIDLGLAEADAPAVVAGDADALRVLLANLLGNALRYTPEGGRVDVICRVDHASVVLEVADNGPGIPESERERVFARFYRRPGSAASGADFDNDPGSGLGLAIVRVIAERHGARISLGDAALGGLAAQVVFPLLATWPAAKPD